MREKFTRELENLADLVLKYSGIHRDYNDEDLSNAMIVLQEILLAKTMDFNRDKLNEEQIMLLVEELGKNIHQSILLASGVDLKNIYDNEYKD